MSSLVISPWLERSAQGHPFTAAEEIRVKGALSNAARTSDRRRLNNIDAKTNRALLSSILTALRYGVDANAVLEVQKGTHPADLRGAYQKAQNQLKAATKAWNAIAAAPNDADVFTANANQASKILPTPVNDIRNGTPAADVITTVQTTTREVDELETDPAAHAAELQDPNGPRNNSYYLPSRVGQLTSSRADTLLCLTTGRN